MFEYISQVFVQYFKSMIFFGFIFWLYRKWIQGPQFTKDIRIDGKIVVITGANSGIGKSTAIDLAKRGGTIYIACRSVQRGTEARNEIQQKSNNKNVHFLQLDLASMKSIRKFAEEFSKKEDKLDILINNAGVYGAPYVETEDGFEMVFCVNYLGHFLLTNLLLKLLKNSESARIINISSLLSRLGRINKNDVMNRDKYINSAVYNQSKLAQVLFTRELAKRLKTDGISSFSLHPGAIDTDVFKNVKLNFSVFAPIFDVLSYLLLKTPEAGIQTTLYCALEPGLEEKSGQYFSDCAVAQPNSLVEDEELTAWLWDKSEKLVQL